VCGREALIDSALAQRVHLRRGLRGRLPKSGKERRRALACREASVCSFPAPGDYYLSGQTRIPELSQSTTAAVTARLFSGAARARELFSSAPPAAIECAHTLFQFWLPP